MVRYDLGFFLCCCKSFLGSADGDGENFYDLLGVENDATPEELKRAYKRRSLEMHPDKLAQRGREVTPEDQARFTRMKEAYEVLSDPHKRETYDAIGEKGMKWLEEPFSIDPQQLAHNFATSSAVDRSKIFGIFVAIAVAIFLLPFLACLMVDHHLGPGAKWIGILTPLWIWDVFILFYHSRVIMMGPIHRPDHIPEEEWVDPLPMSKRFFSLFRFCLIVLFEILVAMKLDGSVQSPWAKVFIPIYVWEATTLWKKVPLAKMKIVTVEDLETALGKPFAEFTQAERELIAKRYSVVPSTGSSEFESAHKLKSRARQDVIKLVFRVSFLIFLIIQLDFGLELNWWLVFTPIWVLSLCICCGTFQSFREVAAAAAERDPETFGNITGKKMTGTGFDEEAQGGSAYGAMGDDSSDTEGGEKKPSLTQEEKEELKGQVMQSGYRMMTACCSQAFLLVIVILFVGKLDGAQYSSVWIISPFLFVAGIILCCLGCTIFCITEIPEEAKFGEDGGPAVPTQSGVDSGAAPGSASAPIYVAPPPPEPAQTAPVGAGTVANIVPPDEKKEAQQASPAARQSVDQSSAGEAENQNTTSDSKISTPPESDGPVDLLDDNPTAAPDTEDNVTNEAVLETNPSTEEVKDKYAAHVMQSSLHELD
eukprot:CAMPEP_0183293296 /NCGR_PEP_ID=MMETSP0160_2-20130417/2029_1 /TAXON_ID=2839 ORGANISM="Odontella Sinensis, Strain Grunow 1884" /NCGR_SAMPLE_ID=MMETSP0160_2 /ASSEMBLY_ACC=CAM_ASM_000250 /LENGTH=650 /DNA_ID=CAMNT_0025454383 /DNA_START=156 /DNA_END=2108 /DNA_ORIENTATION=-